MIWAINVTAWPMLVCIPLIGFASDGVPLEVLAQFSWLTINLIAAFRLADQLRKRSTRKSFLRFYFAALVLWLCGLAISLLPPLIIHFGVEMAVNL